MQGPSSRPNPASTWAGRSAGHRTWQSASRALNGCTELAGRSLRSTVQLHHAKLFRRSEALIVPSATRPATLSCKHIKQPAYSCASPAGSESDLGRILAATFTSLITNQLNFRRCTNHASPAIAQAHSIPTQVNTPKLPG